MAELLLRRKRPLDLLEKTKLPGGCLPVSGEGDIVARAVAEGEITAMLTLAAAMGGAVPDALFSVEGLAKGSVSTGSAAAPKSVKPPPTPKKAVSPPPKPAPEPVEEEGADVPELVDPWDFLDAGNEAEALGLFEGAALDMAGRDRVRELLMSTDPKEVVLACKIARLTNWRSLVMNLRRFLGHADTNVRREVVVTLGALAGPSMTHFVQRLEKDPSPEVRDAVAAALIQLDANG